MSPIFRLCAAYVRKKMWALIVAYMLGMHNFYKGEDKTPHDIMITIEVNEGREDSGGKED